MDVSVIRRCVFRERMGWVGFRVDDHISGWILDGLHDGRDFHDDDDDDDER